MRYSQLANLGNIDMVGAQIAGLARWVATVRDMDENQVMKLLENKTVADIDFFHARAVNTALTQTFFEGDTGGEFTNLNSFLLPTNEFALITAIRIKSAVNATLVASVWTNGVATLDQNAFFTFTVNGVTYRRNFPLLASISAPEDIDQGIIQLNTPIVIGDQEPFSIRIDWEAATVANLNIGIELLGIGTIA